VDGVRRIIRRGLLLVVVAVVTVGIMVVVLETANELGWIPHRRVATVWMMQNWRAGESRSCRLLGDIQTPELLCGNNAERRRMKVEFRGSLHAAEWQCRRKNESLTCTTK
jgi:hypothetical protein